MFARLRSLSRERKQKIQTASFLMPFGLGASLMLYGILRWPMAPIREVAGRYVDKAGKPFTEEVYHQFLVWQFSVFASFIILFASILVVGWVIGFPFGSSKFVRKGKIPSDRK